jgi:hypothetical protein
MWKAVRVNCARLDHAADTDAAKGIAHGGDGGRVLVGLDLVANIVLNGLHTVGAGPAGRQGVRCNLARVISHNKAPGPKEKGPPSRCATQRALNFVSEFPVCLRFFRAVFD